MNRPVKSVALVLGAAVWPGGEASPALRRRALRGAHLFLSGDVQAIICCGGIGKHGPSEADVIRKICLAEGVSDTAIHLEDRSTRTLENIAFSRQLLDELNASRVVLVTDAYHAPRARLIARRLGLTTSSSSPGGNQIPLRQRLRSRLREGPAYLYYCFWPGAFR